MNSVSAPTVPAAPLPAAPTSSPDAGRVRLAHEHSFHVPLPPHRAFVFFEPVGEKAWAEDWQPVFATAEDAALHDGSVFLVERPHPDGSTRRTSLWTITRYEPPRCIEYRNFLPGVRATRITVTCESAPESATQVTVRYVYTGLTPAGDAAIRAITEGEFRDSIAGWARAITDYLRRGTPASP